MTDHNNLLNVVGAIHTFIWTRPKLIDMKTVLNVLQVKVIMSLNARSRHHCLRPCQVCNLQQLSVFKVACGQIRWRFHLFVLYINNDITHTKQIAEMLACNRSTFRY